MDISSPIAATLQPISPPYIAFFAPGWAHYPHEPFFASISESRNLLIMSIPWDQLEHGVIVLDYSKLLIGLAVHGAGVLGGAASFNYVQQHLDAEARLTKMIANWDLILDSLSEEEKATIEQQKPGALRDLRNTLYQLKRSLRFLSAKLQSAGYWQKLWPRSNISKEISELYVKFDKANRDFTETTRVVMDTDHVEAVLEAANAVRAEPEVNIEMNPLPNADGDVQDETSTDSSPEPSSNEANASAPRVTSVQSAREVSMTYQWAVAATAALLPALLRGRSRPKTHVLPV
ncbi:hypothetical protein OH77DRAFT_1430871 [Trametes cingulata]|nr:hypothetical protein OH77DRAFT_1430871 [Trametes cingulata]